MSAIKVQGETYETADDLRGAIDELRGTADAMPDGTPEHSDLLRHIERLEQALNESSGPDDLPQPTVSKQGSAAATSDGETDDDAAEDESPQTLDSAAPVVFCPVCGAETEWANSAPLDDSADRCQGCDGFGKVLTGSRVPGHEIRDCRRCQGQGFVEKASTVEPYVPQTAASAPGWPGAVWDAENRIWLPPPGQEAPWQGAAWDTFLGKWN